MNEFNKGIYPPIMRDLEQETANGGDGQESVEIKEIQKEKELRKAFEPVKQNNKKRFFK